MMIKDYRLLGRKIKNEMRKRIKEIKNRIDKTMKMWKRKKYVINDEREEVTIKKENKGEK